MQMQQSSSAVADPVPSPSNAEPFDNSANVERVVARIIAAKARRLIRQRRFHSQDYEDLVQELTLEWLRSEHLRHAGCRQPHRSPDPTPRDAQTRPGRAGPVAGLAGQRPVRGLGQFRVDALG